MIKSLPRCTFEFFNDMTATEVVLEVGSIVIFLQYAFATAKGLFIVAVILRVVFSESVVSSNVLLEDDIESGVRKKASVPRSVGKTAGNFSKCF